MLSSDAYQKLLLLEDTEFQNLIPKLMEQYIDLLEDEEFDLLEGDPVVRFQAHANRKALFLLLVRSITLLSNSSSITFIIPIALLCDAFLFFLPANADCLQQVISPLRNVYHPDLKKLLGSILDHIRQMERGGGKKSSNAASIDLDRVVAIVNTLGNLSLIWPSVFAEEFWSISYSTSCMLFVYDGISRMISHDDEKGDSEVGKRVQACKKEMLAMFSRMLEEIFWKPLSSGGTAAADDEEKESILNQFCDWSLYILDHSSSNMGQGKVKCLIDAPLLLDLEILYGMSESIQRILAVFTADGKDFDSSRPEYLLMSLESLVGFSGNSQRHIDERQKRIKSFPPSYNQATAVSASATLITAADTALKNPEENVALMLKITHVHDLFPDLGEGFIEACLREFDNDPEVVIMALLENQMPLHLQGLDRSMPSTRLALSMPVGNDMALVRVGSQESIATAVSQTSTANGKRGVDTAVVSLQNLKVDEQQSAPLDPDTQDVLSTRRNVFDGDEFDVMSGRVVDRNMVHIGKKDKTADFEKDRAEFIAQQKAAIIAAQFQVDEDDEYDDTYDATDIKLSGLYNDEGLETAGGGNNGTAHNPHEKKLVEFYKKDPSFFHPSARKSKARMEFCASINWSHEMVEGWFVMFNRNPKKDKILDKYDRPENRPMVANQWGENDEGGSDDQGVSSPSSHANQRKSNSPASRGRGGRGRGDRGKKRGQRIYRPPNE